MQAAHRGPDAAAGSRSRRVPADLEDAGGHGRQDRGGLILPRAIRNSLPPPGGIRSTQQARNSLREQCASRVLELARSGNRRQSIQHFRGPYMLWDPGCSHLILRLGTQVSNSQTIGTRRLSWTIKTTVYTKGIYEGSKSVARRYRGQLQRSTAEGRQYVEGDQWEPLRRPRPLCAIHWPRRQKRTRSLPGSNPPRVRRNHGVGQETLLRRRDLHAQQGELGVVVSSNER